MGVFEILLALNMGKSSTQSSSTGDDSQQQAPPGTGAGGYSDEELDFALAVRAAFNNAVDIDSADPRDEMLVRRLRERQRQKSDDKPDASSSGEATPPLGNNDFARLGGIVSFAQQSASLGPEDDELLGQLAARFQGLRFVVEVRGHASIWESMHDPERGYSLAYNRALSVARSLNARGVSWEQIRLTSCGDAESGRWPRSGLGGTAPVERAEILLSNRAVGDTVFRRQPRAKRNDGHEAVRSA